MSVRSRYLVCAAVLVAAALVLPATTVARTTAHTKHCPTYRTNVHGDPWTFKRITVRGMTCRAADRALRQVATRGFPAGLACRGGSTGPEVCVGTRSRRLTFKSVANG